VAKRGTAGGAEKCGAGGGAEICGAAAGAAGLGPGFCCAWAICIADNKGTITNAATVAPRAQVRIIAWPILPSCNYSLDYEYISKCRLVSIPALMSINQDYA